MATAAVPVFSDRSPILDALPEAIFQLDRAWNVVYMNGAAEQLTGKRCTACVGRPIRTVLPELAGRITRGDASFVFERPLPPGWLQVNVLQSSDGTRVVQVSDVTLEYRNALQADERAEAHRNAELRFEAQQEFIEAVLDSVDAAIVACDETGTLRLFNRAARELHGMDERPIPPGQWASNYNLFYPNSDELLKTEDVPLMRALSGETLRNIEISIGPKEGPRRTLLCSGRALMGRNGRKLGAVIAMHDVTDRRLAGRRLRAALRKFRVLFDDAPVAYHEIDVNGIIRRVNRAECELLGRSRRELIGHPVWDFVVEEEREQSREAVFEKLAGKRPLRTFERHYVRADGSLIMLQIHENLIHDESGRIVGIRTALLDVTEKKAREEAEADSASIRGVLERIGDAYMTFDTEWRYTYVNPKAAELARKAPEELLGRCVWDVFPEAKQTRFYSELVKAMKEQVPSDFENYFAPLGMWFENSVYPSPSGVAVFYRDITERKRTQQSLELRTAELARKNADLETFAYVASHDLQQPLRMIGSFTRLLAQRYKGAIDADADEFIAYTLDGVERMQRLISDLLRLCRVGSPDPSRMVRVNTEAVLDYVRHHLAGMIEDSGATIRVGELPPITFVETHLIQLFQNLISNAIKYKGADSPVVEITAQRGQGSWTFVVRDNGRGFDMQHAEKVFKPFKRLDQADDSGTGIGLAICRKIVESHGGRMWVESVPGEGSTFYFTVPDEIPVA